MFLRFILNTGGIYESPALDKEFSFPHCIERIRSAGFFMDVTGVYIPHNALVCVHLVESETNRFTYQESEIEPRSGSAH